MIFENETPNKRTYKRKAEHTIYNLGKLPPQSIDIEEAILGALMIGKVEAHIWAVLIPEMFYRDNHQRIFASIRALKDEKSPIDILTVKSKLVEFGELEMIGGSYYLTELTSRVASTANIQKHIRIVHQMFLKRELIRIGTQLTNNMYDDTEDPLEAIKTIVGQVKELERGIFKREEKSGLQLAKEAMIEMNTEKPDGLLGTSTGMVGLDRVIKGFQRGHLVAIPAATSMGKSVFMCSLAKNCCFDEDNKIREKQTPVAIFSLEMKSVELTFRLLGNLTDVPVEKIQLNELNETESTRVIGALELIEQAKIYIDDTPGINITELEIKIATMVALYDIKEVYIDYIQLIRFDKNFRSNNREEGYSDISRRLKTLAGELDITIIIFSQVIDEVKKRYLKIPETDDIKYCKAIANDADVVMFLWRPEYYSDVLETINGLGGISCILFNVHITDFTNVGFIIVAKNRAGKLGKIPLKVNLDIMRISDHREVLQQINWDMPTQSPTLNLTTEQREPTF